MGQWVTGLIGHQIRMGDTAHGPELEWEVQWPIYRLNICAEIFKGVMRPKCSLCFDTKHKASPWKSESRRHVVEMYISSVKVHSVSLIAMTLTFDFWPWKPFQQFSLIYVTSLIEITPLRDIISRVIAVNGRTSAGRTTDKHHVFRLLLLAAEIWK